LNNAVYSFISLDSGITVNDGGIIISKNNELITGSGYFIIKFIYYFFYLFIFILLRSDSSIISASYSTNIDYVFSISNRKSLTLAELELRGYITILLLFIYLTIILIYIFN
jgi:hypothetical protein